MNDQNYHNMKHLISASGLKQAYKSMAHYKHYLTESQSETPALIFGRALHSALFEPNDFKKSYVVAPEGIDRRTKEGKAWYATNSDVTVLTHDNMIDINKMIESVESHPLYNDMFFNNLIVETPIIWSNEFRMKADGMLAPCDQYPNGLIIDLKSTINASNREFINQSIKLGYHIQAAHYATGFMQHFETTHPPEFVFIAVEKSAPYLCQYFQIDDELLNIGFEIVDDLIVKIRHAQETGIWSGYSDAMQTMTAPNWLLKDDDIMEIEYV